jgi:hypothetical protein
LALPLFGRSNGIQNLALAFPARPSGNYLTQLVYSAPVDGYYTMLVGLTGEYDIEYDITVR